jgi:hypothetical protein
MFHREHKNLYSRCTTRRLWGSVATVGADARVCYAYVGWPASVADDTDEDRATITAAAEAADDVGTTPGAAANAVKLGIAQSSQA